MREIKFKHIKNIKGYRLWLSIGLVIIALSIAYCGFDGGPIVITQPSTAVAGSNINVTLTVPADMTGGINGTVGTGNGAARLVVGILEPISWVAGANTVITYTDPVDASTQTMTAIPAGTMVKSGGMYTGYTWPAAMLKIAGLAGNQLETMQWVPYWSNTTYSLNAAEKIGPINISIKTTVGKQNTLVKLGYFVGTGGNCDECDLEGGTYSVNYIYTSSTCFSVTGGTSPLADYCDPQLTEYSPIYVTDNDITTLTFNTNVATTALSNISPLYLCATAYTTAGDSTKICVQNSTSQFTPLGGGVFQFQFWPRQYFNLTAGQTLNYVNYYVTDATGNIKVGLNPTTPFSLPFGCQ
jgi:hypothetical protein